MQYIKTTDGIKIAVYEIGPKGGQRTVFLVHGWPLSHKGGDVGFTWLWNVRCACVRIYI